MTELALILTALLFGGMVLYAFGFAAFAFHALPHDVAGPFIRRAFPYFYVFVFASALLAGGAALFADRTSMALLAAIAITTIFARQILMPAINDATDAGNKKRFAMLHTISVLITLAHIAAAGVTLVLLARL
ncbi:MAG: DUF4149 domain-containing protein [Pseudomonadota bacterium]